MKVTNALILAPHTDDAELGCGGTIARFIEEGVKVTIAVFSSCRASLPKGAEPNQLREEFFKAAKVLKVPESQLLAYDYPVRQLSNHRQPVLEELVRLKRELSPEMVFVPSGSDVHQDHTVVYQEGVRAFKDVTLWGYELPWNHITFSAHAFISLTQNHIDQKCAALDQYETQKKLGRPYFTREFVEGLARVRGVQVREKFAEAFEVIRVKW